MVIDLPLYLNFEAPALDKGNATTVNRPVAIIKYSYGFPLDLNHGLIDSTVLKVSAKMLRQAFSIFSTRADLLQIFKNYELFLKECLEFAMRHRRSKRLSSY